MAGCGPGSPCDRVMGSSWAYWLNVPVSAPALAIYLVLTGCALGAGSQKPKVWFSWNAGLILSIFAAATALYFTYLQVEVLKSICKFCTSTHLLGITGAAIFLWNAPRPAGWNFSRTLRYGAIALAMMGVVVGGQRMFPHKTNLVSIYRGKFQFNLRNAPLIGNPSNNDYIISLFDYTCPDCHDMHALLQKARQRKNNSFSIISLPVPLDANCNPAVRETRPKHKDACTYARIGLATRRCGREIFQQYDEWFFGSGSIPTLEAAREKAESLAGKQQLDSALADPWVEQTLREGISIYEENGRSTKSYRMPQLIIGNAVASGPVSGLDELIQLLDTRLPVAASAKQ